MNLKKLKKNRLPVILVLVIVIGGGLMYYYDPFEIFDVNDDVIDGGGELPTSSRLHVNFMATDDEILEAGIEITIIQGDIELDIFLDADDSRYSSIEEFEFGETIFIELYWLSDKVVRQQISLEFDLEFGEGYTVGMTVQSVRFSMIP